MIEENNDINEQRVSGIQTHTTGCSVFWATRVCKPIGAINRHWLQLTYM